MRNHRGLVVAAALFSLLLLAGCTTSDWRFVRTRPADRLTTNVTVRTEPSDAEVSLNGNYLGESPIRVPVMYPVEIKVYERRVAVPFPKVESRDLKTYVFNVFTFTAYKTGYHEGSAEVTLRGNEEREITIKLKRKSR
jgi:hypothetical protein